MAFIHLNPEPCTDMIVPKEELNLFYSAHRQLFTRLVVGLGRETSQSTHVMAFIMWIEVISKDISVVSKILYHWPDIMLKNLAEEIAIILDCVENSRHSISPGSENFPLINNILCYNITLDYFLHNRIRIIYEVTKFINDVCVRVFRDIIEQVHYERAMKAKDLCLANINGGMIVNPHMQPQGVYYAPNSIPTVPQKIVVPPSWTEFGSSSNDNALDTSEVSRKVELKPDLSEIFANLNLDDIYYPDTSIVTPSSNVVHGDDTRNNKSIDERTLLMTFSTSYLISENEVMNYFTRKYGDIVEKMIMHEAETLEHPSYAYLVVRPEAINIFDHLLQDNPKIKFSINGKHVWARKYSREIQLFEAEKSKFFQ